MSLPESHHDFGSCGPIVGGALADSILTWRWAFYINLCIAAVTAPVCIWLLPSRPIDTTLTRLQRLFKIEFLGVTLFVEATTSFIMAVDGALFHGTAARSLGSSSSVASPGYCSAFNSLGVWWRPDSIGLSQSSMWRRMKCLVTAFTSCGQIAGVALSICIGSSILLNKATNNIAVILPEVSRSTVQASIAGVGATFLNNVSEEQRTKVLASVASILRYVFYIVLAGGASATLLSVFMKRERFSRMQV